MTKRRQRSDSVAAAVDQFQTAAQAELMPPAHSPLPDAAMPFWHAIVRGRARAEWDETPALLTTARNLAWTQWQSIIASGWFDGTGVRPEGMPLAAICTRLNDLQRLEMSYLRTLQQHARGAQGETRDASKRRAEGKAVSTIVDAVADDEFLAQPTVQ